MGSVDEVARRLKVDFNELQRCTDLDAIIEGIRKKCSTTTMVSVHGEQSTEVENG